MFQLSSWPSSLCLVTAQQLYRTSDSRHGLQPSSRQSSTALFERLSSGPLSRLIPLVTSFLTLKTAWTLAVLLLAYVGSNQFCVSWKQHTVTVDELKIKLTRFRTKQWMPLGLSKASQPHLASNEVTSYDLNHAHIHTSN